MSREKFKSFKISAEYQGQRIDAVLSKLFPEFSRTQWTHWLQEEKIKINSKSVKPKTKIIGGEDIAFTEDFYAQKSSTPILDEPEPIPLDIIFEDKEILIINKPAGLVVHRGAGNPRHTLVNALIYHDPNLQNLPRAGLVHRLDKETTGLLVIGKTLSAQTHLSRQIQDRSMHRRYIALVQGHIVASGEVNTMYARHPRNRLKMTVSEQGRSAITRFFPRKKYQNDYTLLDLELLTGRTHQIRVHMAHIKHPVFGDPLYGGRMRYPANANENLLSKLQQFKRQALHAASLSLKHPANNSLLEFSAPLPDDFKNLLTALEEHYDNL